MKLPKRLKARWLKALRSGEYGQTKFTLCDGEGNFCCLGVLEHIAMSGSVETHRLGNYKDLPTLDFYKYANIDVDKVRMVPEGPRILDYHVMKLMSMNDNSVSFKEIADWIEEQIETK